MLPANIQSPQVILLFRNHHNDKYSSAEYLFSGEYNIYELLTMYPQSAFLLVNDDTEYGQGNVFREGRIKEVFGIDKKNEMKCQSCKAKIGVAQEYCHCGYKNKYYPITKFLSGDFKKAAEVQAYINWEFWNEREYMD